MREISESGLLLGDWWKEEDLPVNWDAVFPGGPISVEVGFGAGEFLLSLARREPVARFVGIERFREGHQKLVKAFRREGLTNILPMVGDAFVIMNLAFCNGSLSRVYSNFPDPWPKPSHARKRLYVKEFFDIVAKKLAPGGKLFLATDSPPLADQALLEISSVEGLRPALDGIPWLEESPHETATRYEKKWKAEGRPIRYMIYERPEGAADGETKCHT